MAARTKTYTSDGVGKKFQVPFHAFANTDISVTKTVSGTTTTLAEGIDYDVSLPPGDASAFGFITLRTALAKNATIAITRTPNSQPPATTTVASAPQAMLEYYIDFLLGKQGI